MSTLRGATKKFVDEAFAMDMDGCILWPFALHPRGYPMASDADGVYKPHRRICEMRHGPAPTIKHHAAHSCGTRACINKRHLFWKTPKENEADKRGHGRMADNRLSRRKLTVEDVRVIRARGAKGELPSVIAADFPITHAAVRKIIERQTYRDIA